MAKLVLLLDGNTTSFELTETETVLGRHPECTIQVNSNMVSRRHARLVKGNSGYLLEDLGSGNGTFLNGKKVDEPTVVGHDDRIKLGPVMLRYEDPDSAAAATAVGSTVVRKSTRPDFAATLAVDIASGEHDNAQIMSTTADASGFGKLEIQPEAKLKAVLEISRSLAGTVDLDAILPKILDTLFKIFPHADRGCILFRAEDSDKLVPRVLKHRRADEDESVKLSRTILKAVMEQKTGILSADAASDSRFQASESISSLTIRSMMCVPLLSVGGEVMGIIHIDTQNAFNQFRPEDLDLLIAVAGQAAMSYETARLMVTFLEKQKQDREMGIAANVQLALLPESMPIVPGYEFYASYDSAQAVGGDYYDCMMLGADHVCFAFGDVAGKGVPASLVMSRLSSVVQNVMTFVSDLGEAISRINGQMCAKAVEGRFVTFVLGLLHVPSGKLKIAIAGHMPIMIRKPDGTVEEFGEEIIGVPLGVIEDYPFDVAERIIQPGELCVIYTDGVSEAMNPDSDLYGMDRLRKLMVDSPAGAGEQLGKTILADVRKFAAGRPQNDDITLMVFGRK